MPLADPLAATPPEIRTYALVGQFLFHWAGLEATLSDAVERAFGLTAIQGVVLTSNVWLEAKVRILRTVVDESLEEPDCAQYKRVLRDILKFSAHRNMMAHSSFYPDDESDGVLFVYPRAAGSLKLEHTRWTLREFQDKVDDIDAFNAQVEQLTPKLKVFTQWRDAATALSAIMQVQADDR
jgi:hypothetical protein